MKIGALRFILAALTGVLLAGCNAVPVRQDLTQEQASEIVAVLHQHGISAEAVRETGGRGAYRVETKREMYSQAVALLYEKGLPSEPRQSFDELVAPRGLIPNSREVEALRLDRARATEIESALTANPAVRTARVIVRTERNDGIDRAFSSSAPESLAGASAVIVRRLGQTVAENEVRDIVQRVVPGIQRENIDVKIYDANPEEAAETVGVANTGGIVQRIPLTSFLGAWRVPEDDYHGLALTLAVGIVLVFTVGFAVGWGGSFFRSAPRPSANPLQTEYFSEKLVLPRGASRVSRESDGRRELPGGGA